MRFFGFLSVVILACISAFTAEIPLQAKQVPIANLIADKISFTKYFMAIAAQDKPSIVFALSDAEKNALSQGCYDADRLVASPACLAGLSQDRRDQVLLLLSQWYDDFSPSYTLTFNPGASALLNQEPYIQFLNGRVDFQTPTDAKAILPPLVASRLWTSTVKYYQANCLGTSIASVNKNTAPVFVWPPEENLPKYFEEISENEPLQVGDIFAFIIPGDGHFFTYIGTDEATHARMVLTKNGSAPGFFQFTRYQDVVKVYAKYTTGTTRYRSLNLIRSPLLYLKNNIKVLNFAAPKFPALRNPFMEYLNGAEKSSLLSPSPNFKMQKIMREKSKDFTEEF